jgi:hypothetical protein
VNYYAEVGRRYVMYGLPANYDNWGWSEDGDRWEHSFCVTDDFGTAVPVEPWAHEDEGCVQILTPEGLFTPNVH